MSRAFSIKFDAAAAYRMLDDVADECEAAARPAAQAMAQVLYDQVKANVGRLRRRTGNLAASIYQAYSASNSRPGVAAYHVSWNAKKAPHGHLVEFGHLQRYEISFDRDSNRFITHKDRPLAAPKHVAARPFIRPAMGHAQRALDAGRGRYFAELQAKGLIK